MRQTFKQLISLTTLLLAISPTSFSQTSKFSISINSLTTNFNYGKSNATLQPFKKNFTGLQAGFSYQAGITPVFSIVPELYFSIKGGTLKENNPLTIGKSTLRLYSIELPVLARVHCKKLYFNAGAYSGYALSGRMKIDGYSTTSASSSKLLFGKGLNDFKRFDFVALVGAGYNFTVSRTNLNLDARYGYGLTNISKDVERHNRVLNISLVVSNQHRQKNK